MVIYCVLNLLAIRCDGELLHGCGPGLQQTGRIHQIQRASPDRQRL